MAIHGKRRILALGAGLLMLLAAGTYFTLCAARTLRLIGMANELLISAVSVSFALLCLCTFVIRPIPIKVTTITVLYFLTFGLIADLIHFIVRFTAPGFALWNWLHASGVFVLAASALTLLYGWLHGRRIALKRYRIGVPQPLPNGKLRVALVSDLHMGKSIDTSKLARICSLLGAQSPDILLLAGDLCDDQTTPSDMLAACALLGGIPTKYGTYFVYGNHDLGGHGPALKYPVKAYLAALERNGIQVLDDACVSVSGLFTVAGRRDAWMAHSIGGRIPLEELLKDADRAKPVLLMDHQPLDTKEAASQGVALQVSGHTHAGQVFPASWLGRLIPNADVFYGHKQIGETHIVVSSGLGCRGSTLRSGCTAEFVLIDLRTR
jgi:hypothetical protein